MILALMNALFGVPPSGGDLGAFKDSA